MSTSAGTDQPLVAKLPGNVAVKRGDTLKFDAAAGDLHIFDGEGRSFDNTLRHRRRLGR